MATEGSNIRDGSNFVAAANYASGAGLSGPNTSGQFLGMYISASRTLTVDATGGQVIYGVLQNSPASGGACEVVIFGTTKAVAGAAFAVGADLMTDSSGRFITATSTNRRCAIAIVAATGSGQIITVHFTGANRTA